MIHYFPLEHLQQRYTVGMDDAITRHLADLGVPFVRYYPSTDGRAEQDPGDAFFFHPAATIEFRALQLAMFSRVVQAGNVSEGDIVFLSDLLLPGVEAIGWLNQFYDLNLDIRGLVHAGSFTDADMTRKWERWAAPYEIVALDLANRVFVGSDFIKRDIYSKRLVDPRKIIVTGFPSDAALPKPRPWSEKENIVVFTGRDSPEKQPELLTKLAHMLMGPSGPNSPRVNLEEDETVHFVNAVRAKLSKAEYHDLLSRAKVVVSFALQETYGVGVQEGIRMGCVPIVPNRECYPEQFDRLYLYDTLEQCAQKVADALNGHMPLPDYLDHESSVVAWFAE